MDPISSLRGRRHSLLSSEKDLVRLASQLANTPEVELIDELSLLIARLCNGAVRERFCCGAIGSRGSWIADDEINTVNPTDSPDTAPESVPAKQVLLANAAEVSLTIARPNTRSSSGLLPHPKRARSRKAGSSALYIKSAGCSIPAMKNLHLRKPYVKLTSGLGKAMEVVNAYTEEAESPLRDVPHKDTVDGMKKILEEIGNLRGVDAELEEKLKAAQEQIGLVKEESIGALQQANDMVALNRKLELGGRFREILESIREKFRPKRPEATAEIKLQKLVANLDLLEDLVKMEISEDSNETVMKVNLATQVPTKLDQHRTNELTSAAGLGEEEMIDGE
ncbi:hypothetical protein AALP_AA2G038700 [Arabis alpina]|uniref:Uncharacterized protein n=1 Tax=Arabis alpina TaxID=50452 RepID=A0A087HF68_ARAAL|nr:hypothetical protein AALP_AA2G038700 [Arabis alpina]